MGTIAIWVYSIGFILTLLGTWIFILSIRKDNPSYRVSYKDILAAIVLWLIIPFVMVYAIVSIIYKVIKLIEVLMITSRNHSK